ncbi:Phosphoheptose isomerase [Desulfobacca acetoxidans DSM 11109]|uniref:Phosphoheptose isomerase n=2 Tax=Desulfobacca acetoxidans TaxID=60893 RepID=F2ND81_DESAR|nr:D-sedoheptulose 7-phosphate isomerase [Desulfobacca acetoxidans]AEB09805.1 Phosphoheptose isomerase [Desulfobacca acetoxidans DSM 11109]
MLLEHRVKEAFSQSMQLMASFMEEQTEQVVAAARMLATVLREGNKLLLFGNGGSAADAQHLAAEFVNRFQIERPPLAAIALTTDSSILTAVGNDYDFREVFVKQVQALGQKGDVAWGISTSGDSPNVVQALTVARAQGLKTLAVTGREGGKMAPLADIALIVRSRQTPRIQEVQLAIGHILCDLVDFLLFPERFQ